MNSTMMVVIGSRLLLSLSVLALIVGTVIIQPTAQATIGREVELIRDKLENASCSARPSLISFSDLANAYNQSDKFYDIKIKVDLVNEIKERRPTVELTVDLLVAMSNQYKSIVNGEGVSSQEAREFIKRLEVFYDSLRSEYLYKTAYTRPCVKSDKADALIHSIIENFDSKPLSRELIEEAKREYDEQVIHFNDIKSTDLPQETGHLTARVNYLNLEETGVLVKLVFPTLEQPDPIDFAELRYIFTDAIEQLNYQRKGRRLVDISKFRIADDE